MPRKWFLDQRLRADRKYKSRAVTMETVMCRPELRTVIQSSSYARTERGHSSSLDWTRPGRLQNSLTWTASRDAPSRVPHATRLGRGPAWGGKYEGAASGALCSLIRGALSLLPGAVLTSWVCFLISTHDGISGPLFPRTPARTPGGPGR